MFHEFSKFSLVVFVLLLFFIFCSVMDWISAIVCSNQ